MKIIIDANILFSALIKDSFTAEMMFNENLELLAPSFLIEEFMKYQKLILKKTKREKEDFVKTLHIFKEIIQIIDPREYSNLMEQAKEISPDIDDVVYFAMALKFNCPIWSNDKRLKNQDYIKIISTKDLAQII